MNAVLIERDRNTHGENKIKCSRKEEYSLWGTIHPPRHDGEDTKLVAINLFKYRCEQPSPRAMAKRPYGAIDTKRAVVLFLSTAR